MMYFLFLIFALLILLYTFHIEIIYFFVFVWSDIKFKKYKKEFCVFLAIFLTAISLSHFEGRNFGPIFWIIILIYIFYILKRKLEKK